MLDELANWVKENLMACEAEKNKTGKCGRCGRWFQGNLQHLLVDIQRVVSLLQRCMLLL